jgi:hypothetical protein
MTIPQLSIPIYEIDCPACKKSFLLPLGKVVTEDHTNCPACYEHIKATNYYLRTRIIELMKKVGYNDENFISVNDKF